MLIYRISIHLLRKRPFRRCSTRALGAFVGFSRFGIPLNSSADPYQPWLALRAFVTQRRPARRCQVAKYSLSSVHYVDNSRKSVENFSPGVAESGIAPALAPWIVHHRAERSTSLIVAFRFANAWFGTLSELPGAARSELCDSADPVNSMNPLFSEESWLGGGQARTVRTRRRG